MRLPKIKKPEFVPAQYRSVPAPTPADAVSREAARIERELRREERDSRGRKMAPPGSIPPGNVVAMEFQLVYDDGTRVTMARNPITPNVLVSGQTVEFQNVSVTVS